MILLKHLSRDFDVEPYKLRKILRVEFGHHRRWQWENDNHPELKRVKKFLSTHGASGSEYQKNAKTTSSPRTKEISAIPHKR
jgi:hypothetical protein